MSDMNLTNEQIKCILEDAPDWARYFNTKMGAYASQDNRHNLTDLREILALRQRVQELEEEVSTAIEIIEDSGMDYDEIVAAKEQDDE